MPVTFLNPALLFGLLAAGVPVIIHFLSRRRTRRVAFSDLRFLQEEEAQQARRRGIQRWLLLLMRVLIVCCLALAAARPYWGGLEGGGRAVLFVIDTSASMQAQEADGRTRCALALDLAGGMLQALPAGSTVQAVLAGAGARPLFAGWLPVGAPARAALATAAVQDGPGDLAAALREAARLVREAPARPVEVVLLSDLQAVARPGLAAAAAELGQAGARLLIRQIGDGVPGGAVVDVALPGRALRSGEVAEVAAVVRPERPGQSFWLELDGRRVAESVAPAPPADGGDVRVVFPLTMPRAGLHTGKVGKEPDRLPVDDERPFVLSVPDRLEVLLVHGPDHDALGRGGWRYLARALDPAADGQGLFRVRAVESDSLLDGALGAVDLLVLVDPGAVGRRLSGALREWLAGGGALLVISGDPGQADDLGESLLPLVDLPRGAAWTARDEGQAERARVVDPAHPILAGLGEPALAALAAARWWRYFTIDEGSARVLLVADSGAPLFLEGELGEGRWAVLPFHLRRDATDLMLNPVFLPLVQRTAARLVTGGDPVANLEVGQPPVLRLAADRLRLRPGETAAQLDVLGPPDGQPRPAGLAWRGAIPVLSAPASERAGFYFFRAAGDTLGAVAAAVPAGESEPRVETPGDFAGRLREAGLARVLDLGQAGAAAFSRTLAGRDLARWLLGGALGLMALELWLGRRVR